jgi:hypothetical protein
LRILQAQWDIGIPMFMGVAGSGVSHHATPAGSARSRGWSRWRQGGAVERIDPRGFVRSSGELWRAEIAHGARPIEKGETVKVTARHRFTLLVEPAADLAVRSPLHEHVAENRETR